MATNLSYIEYVCEQLEGTGEITYKKMFGEFMIYLNSKPVLIVCDNTTYCKKLPEIESLMKEADTGCPYEGAKEHYILNIDDEDLAKRVVLEIEKVTPIPKKRVKK